MWSLEPVQGGGYQIRNKHSNRCLLVSWRTPENMAPAVQYDCDAQYADQIWMI
ncbi:RICIN domain-containing protein [Streptomyces silvensis]|uniref:RICIN domain-containing protein n=1 Tax=Streptomyces silvensis TaxID=1765722 RepID=UPI0026D6EA40